LRIDTIYTTSSSWFNQNAQVDILIDRSDNVMHLFEMKFYNSEFAIDNSYFLDLKIKLPKASKNKKAIRNDGFFWLP